MSKYTVISGDNFEKISRRVYGTESKATLLITANPGINEPLTIGVVLTVPSDPTQPSLLPPTAPSTNPDETAILIENERFRFWDQVSIGRAMDALDQVEFSASFNIDDLKARESFRPFSFKAINISVGGDRLFTGTMVSVVPDSSVNSTIASVGCYSRPGVLNDCTIPATSLPSEFNNQNLKDIASSLCSLFGLGAVFSSDSGSAFDSVAIDPGERVFSFLAKLAKQRNLIISSTEKGELLFQKELDSSTPPVANLESGVSPVTKITASFNPQEYFSDLTGIEQALVGLAGSNYTVKNNRLQGVVRPVTFEILDSVGGDVQQTVEARAGRMFGSTVSYTVEISSWRDPAGNLWAPNTFVNLLAPESMVYSNFKFLIRRVTLATDKNRQTAKLDLVLPGSFSGMIPEVLPWDV